MTKNKKTFNIAAVTAVFLLTGLLIAQSNVFAQDLSSYLNGDKNAISISEFVENIQASKADVSGIKPEIEKPRTDIVAKGGLGINLSSGAINNDYDTNEFIQFWDDLREDVWEDICKAARLDLSEKAEIADIVGIKGKFKRYLKQYPDKRIALIDEVGVGFTGNHTSEIFNIADNPFNVSFNAKMEGKSIVVRRLNGIKYCDEILPLLDLRKVKTILPVKAERISKMKPGEIWKFPIILSIGLGGSISHNFNGLSVSLSFGSSREKKPSITLYKMDEKTLRLRVRLDRATFKSVGASAGAFSVSAGDIGLFETENLLTKLVNKEIAREFNKYLSLKLGLSHDRAKGKKILIEFLLDARDSEQIDRLVDFLKGDLGVLRKLLKMGSQFNNVDVENDIQAGSDALNDMDNVGEDSLETESNFVGSAHFNSHGNAFNVQIPLLHSCQSDSNLRYDRYQTVEGKEILHSHQASQNISRSSINIPWIGKRHKRNVRQTMYVVNYEKMGGEVSEPVVLYQRYDGAVRYSESTARSMIEDANDILQYAGTNGEGTNPDYTIDTNPLFPKLAEAENNPEYDENGFAIPPARRQYKSAILSFSIVFTKTAIRDIINAPAKLVMKAFFNILAGFNKKVIDQVAHLFDITADGKVKYSYGEVARVLKKEFYWMDDNDDRESPMNAVRDVCYKVSRIVADLASVKNAAGWKEQSKLMAKVLSGKSKSRIGYSRMLKLLVQFVNPKNLYANINFQTHKKIEGEEDITVKQDFFNPEAGMNYDSQMANATELRNMFNNPSTLTD
ncbi:MAG: hypothetical protein L6420_10320 [Elusimicrobia bacterium]|nr:hypothetical protein [Elusimicrobiota bacterium]